MNKQKFEQLFSTLRDYTECTFDSSQYRTAFFDITTHKGRRIPIAETKVRNGKCYVVMDCGIFDSGLVIFREEAAIAIPWENITEINVIKVKNSYRYL